MNKSESIKNLALALSKAQKKIGSAVKGSSNPFYKSKYADLAAVMETCKEQLNSEGITVLQPVVSDATGDYVETILLHESGELLSEKMRLHPSKNMQELGSNISYARRYSLQSMVFIPQVDDDGESAMNRSKPETSTKTETKGETKADEPTKPNPWRKPKPTEAPKAAGAEGMSF